jgi:hypothetical protein
MGEQWWMWLGENGEWGTENGESFDFRIAVLDWNWLGAAVWLGHGWTHCSVGFELVERSSLVGEKLDAAVLDGKKLDGLQCWREIVGRTAVRPFYSLFTNHYSLIK